MADVSKLKALKSRADLGQPPTLEEASSNLSAPEVAPAGPAATPQKRIDGRSARKTNRTVQFATRVSPEWDSRIRAISIRDGKLLVEILEEALDFYEKSKGSS